MQVVPYRLRFSIPRFHLSFLGAALNFVPLVGIRLAVAILVVGHQNHTGLITSSLRRTAGSRRRIAVEGIAQHPEIPAARLVLDGMVETDYHITAEASQRNQSSLVVPDEFQHFPVHGFLRVALLKFRQHIDKLARTGHKLQHFRDIGSSRHFRLFLHRVLFLTAAGR